MQDLLTIDQVAGIIQCSPWTVRSWIKGGELNSVRIGRRMIRVRREDLNAFIRHNAIGAGTDDELTKNDIPAMQERHIAGFVKHLRKNGWVDVSGFTAHVDGKNPWGGVFVRPDLRRVRIYSRCSIDTAPVDPMAPVETVYDKITEQDYAILMDMKARWDALSKEIA